MNPVPAATVLLVRDAAPDRSGRSEVEVLMLRRNPLLDFVGGAHVFPGGRVDDADHGDADDDGPTDANASAVLDLADGGRAYWIAALRECFEETGLLLAEGPGLAPLLADADRRERARADLEAGVLSFADLCRRESVALRAGALRYFARWITPEPSPRRYDTRFFVAPAPVGQTPVPDAAEALDCEWVRPTAALARDADGDIELILPTRRCLELISPFERADDLFAALDAPTGLVRDHGGWRRVLADRHSEGVPA